MVESDILIVWEKGDTLPFLVSYESVKEVTDGNVQVVEGVFINSLMWGEKTPRVSVMAMAKKHVKGVKVPRTSGERYLEKEIL